MITLYQPPKAWGLPSMSPFCVKVETFLRMSGIPYQTKIGDIRKAPKGRVPYIEDSESTMGLMGDSGLIVDYLRDKYKVKIDQNLSADQCAQALVMRRMIEEHHYFVGAWFRWHDDSSFKYVKDFFKPLLPPVIGGVILNQIRKTFLGVVRDQGVGAHSRAEILHMAKENVEALSQLLGSRPFFMGSEPTSVDATAFGFLVQSIWVPWDNELKTMTRAYPNLVAYCHRMRERYFPEALIPAAT